MKTYVNPDNRRQKWNSKGRRPKWLVDKLAKGAKLADYEDMMLTSHTPNVSVKGH